MTKFEIGGIRREQKKDEIFLYPSVSFYHKGRTLVVTVDGGKFCKLDELHLMTPYDEDNFCERIAARFVRRYVWTAWFNSIRKFIPFLKPKPKYL